MGKIITVWLVLAGLVRSVFICNGETRAVAIIELEARICLLLALILYVYKHMQG